MFLIPTRVDVYSERKPWANWLLVSLIVLCFIFQLITPYESWEQFMLHGWNPLQMISRLFLHADFIHLLGNCIFLLVFGNAVCSKVGNKLYLPLFFAFGFISACCHLTFCGITALGASGAIFGIVGAYLVLYPTNKITCLFFIYIFPRTISVRGFWIIMMWVAFNLIGVALGWGGVAYFSHLGGFFGGVIVFLILLHYKKLNINSADVTIVDALLYKKRLKSMHSRIKAEKKEMEEQRKKAAILRRPKSDEKLHLVCLCGAQINVPRKYAGKKGRCPKCLGTFQVPGGVENRSSNVAGAWG